MSDFAAVTDSYERWREQRTPQIEADLVLKHERLASSPFAMFRGTYYRFLAQFPQLLGELAAAPAAVVVGDLHSENFGTWRDQAARLVWGVNDFDEIDVLPYTVDLVRLATSALLAGRAGHLATGAADACDAILSGWRSQLEQGNVRAFVLGEQNGHLYRLAAEAIEQPDVFARTLRELPRWPEALPQDAAALLAQVTPWPGFEPELRRRTAGVGSLGSRRIVALAELDGGLLVREAKEIPGPASLWLAPDRKTPGDLVRSVLARRGVAADPWRRQSDRWVLRPLAPDATRLDLAALQQKHDEARLLSSMGAEAANVHMTGHSQTAPVERLLRDAASHPPDWLHQAARKMAALTEADHASWRHRFGR